MRVTGADGRAGCGMTDYISREAVLTALFNGEHNLYSWDEIEDRLSAIPAADVRPVEWIPVTERLPEKDGWYLVSDGFISWTAMFLGEKTVWAGNFKFGLTGITHWMPLPEPPKEET